MPRTYSKRNNQRNDNSTRVPVASNLSPNAPEFIPITNDDNTSVNQSDLPLQPITLNGSTNASNSSGTICNSNSSEVANTSTSTALANKGQRDLLINLLNDSKVDCVICYERTKNVEPIWSCRNCFQIMHLKCIMVWFIKSHTNSTWRCPACQSNVVGKPNYVCFCGALPNPFSNNVDTPHSCGQVCGLRKKNTNSEFDDCHHKCTLLCHPGPCPQCVVQVLRNCGCGKTKVYAHCGQSTPILCQNICSKILNCKNHVCEKKCHADKCEPCKKLNAQCLQMVEQVRRSPQRPNFPFFPAQDHLVTDEELRMLGLDPTELLPSRENDNMIIFDDANEYTTDDEDIIFDDTESMDYDGMMHDEFGRYSPTVDHVVSHMDIPSGGQLRILRFGNYRPIRRAFGGHSVTSSISSASASFSNTNTNNSSDNTNSSNNDSNNTSDSNSENDDDTNLFDVDESGDDLPLDLSSYDPNRFDTDEGGSYEGYSEEEVEETDMFSDSQEVVHMNSEFSDETSDSEDSSGISQSHQLSFLLDSNSSSTDTTTDTSTDNTTTDTSSSN